ncbi:MAG: ferric iron uptake transcriptional regulator [Gammaproteobacteria bacterium]|nr:ferric iron uptake transcriptional regulator [Gammaproteobacteria bacterium]
MSGSAELKGAGLKATAPRLKILELMEESSQRHMTAEDVYRGLLDMGDEVGLATVYRVLTQFEAAGLVIRHSFEEDRAIYELADESHHDHMVCMRCGKIQEFTDCGIEQLQMEAATRHGFRVSSHSLYLYGLCADCGSSKS